MKRRDFIKGVCALSLVGVAPSLVSPRDIPIPENASELYSSMNRIFRKYPVDSIMGYVYVNGKRYDHISYQLGSPALDMEKRLCHSLWLTACMKAEGNPGATIVWRKKPEYREYNMDSPNMVSRIFIRFAIVT